MKGSRVPVPTFPLPEGTNFIQPTSQGNLKSDEDNIFNSSSSNSNGNNFHRPHNNVKITMENYSSLPQFLPPPAAVVAPTPSSFQQKHFPDHTNNNNTNRKRMLMDIDESNNSQAAGSCSTSSGISSAVDIDSMRPVATPRAKRRKTGILDAFNSISLVQGGKRSKRNNDNLSTTLRKYSIAGDQENDDADSSQAVADETDNVEDNGSEFYSSTGSSLGDDSSSAPGLDEDDEDGNGTGSVGGDSSDATEDRLLSDAELVVKKEERKVMLELVFGPNSEFVPRKDPVDVKFKQLLQKTWQQQTAAATAGITKQTQDDIKIDHHAAYGGSATTQQNQKPPPIPPREPITLQRSNSLPDMSIASSPMADSDVDMV